MCGVSKLGSCNARQHCSRTLGRHACRQRQHQLLPDACYTRAQQGCSRCLHCTSASTHTQSPPSHPSCLCRERLEKLQQHVLKQGVAPSAFLPVVCDITKDAEVAALPKIVAKRWPDSGIDVLVRARA
jgi:hypothetical protein